MRTKSITQFLAPACFLVVTALPCAAQRTPLPLHSDDVIPTGNEWVAMPDIRAADGALDSFNAMTLRDRGLLEVRGAPGEPVLKPYFRLDGKPLHLQNLSWDLISYWIPVAHQNADGLEATITYCAPPGFRAAFVRLTLANHGSSPVKADLGIRGSWGALDRVTYTPVELRGDRQTAPAPWKNGFGEVFAFITSDTHFAWSLLYPESKAFVNGPPAEVAPTIDAFQTHTLAPGESAEAYFVFGVGLEEYSATQSAAALSETIDRLGTASVIQQAADWYAKRTRTTGRADLDQLMNRNFIFTAMYAWGKALDSEQLVGVTSRSPRYYVSAAYWDRDAMLWSFPGLLDIDTDLAREALDYALTTQLHNVGTHSRFIDGVVLEDGLELDMLAAPILALHSYMQRTGDVTFLAAHRSALDEVRGRILGTFDPQTGLYATLQDAQDEYRKQPFNTVDNVMAWRAFLDLADMYRQLREDAIADDLAAKAQALRSAILHHSVDASAPGAGGPIFVSATDGKTPIYADVPPGSLMKLPAFGFVDKNDPIFQRTYAWLHSGNYPWSYDDRPYGLPGSYRLPFTPVWTVADHLSLEAGRDQATKILLGSHWDGGIITEGIDPTTAIADHDGRAFATAAGYVADAICRAYCTDRK